MTKDAENVHWDLSDLFASETDPTLEDAIQETLTKAAQFERNYKGKLLSLSPSELKEAFEKLENLLIPLYKVSQYASLRYSIETQNNDIKALVGRCDDIESTVSNHIVFFDLELSKMPKKDVESLKRDPVIQNYYYSILHSVEMAGFNLKEAEEKMITIKDVTGKTGYKKLYSELTADFSYTFTVDGEEKTLNGTEMRNLRYHTDKTVRRAAMTEFYKKYEDNSITITHVFNHIFKDFNTERKLRGYKAPISVRNTSNDLSDKAVQVLHDVTTASNTLVQRYYKIKAKLLNCDDMTLADIYAPLPDQKASFSYEQAKQLVLDGFYSFDKEFGDIAKAMFDENRIHAPVMKSKRGGAFCSGSTPDVKPYVMLNFLGKPRDVSTMAHELGHAIHDVYAAKQTLINYHPILPLAETASVFSEMIISDLIMKQVTDKESKISLICEKLEDVFATSHRQNMFSCFEHAVHEKVSEKMLSTEEYCDIYHEGLKKMFGDAVTITPEYRWEWSTIPHFVDYPFYVYAYNFGNLLVFALYQQYQEEGVSFVPKLKEVLRAGSAQKPVEIASYVGADIESEAFWKKSITCIEAMVDELEALVG